jgi:alanyl-tRNA synthetase
MSTQVFQTSTAVAPLPSIDRHQTDATHHPPSTIAGAGLERVTSILQNKRSNYDIDLFQELFTAIKAVCPETTREYRGLVGADDVDHIDTAYRVVADHIRTLTFAIADGCVPSNTRRVWVPTHAHHVICH